jgi:hypothetical protein
MVETKMGRGAHGLVAALFMSVALVGCMPEGSDGDGGENNGDVTNNGTNNGGADGFELVGTYAMTFGGGMDGGEEVITEDAWSFFELIEYDNEANEAITKNADDAEFNPGTYNKNVWTEPDGDGVFHYCTVDFGLETLEAAQASEETADSSDLAMGCGGFSWNTMTPK